MEKIYNSPMSLRLLNDKFNVINLFILILKYNVFKFVT